MTTDNPIRAFILEFLHEQTGGQVALDHVGDIGILEGGFLDSLSIVLLMENLSEKFEIEIEDEDFEEENFATLEALCGFVDRKMPEPA